MSKEQNKLSLLPSDLIPREDQNEFKLKFDGKLHEVDASTLGYSLLNITNLIQEVNQELGTGQKIEIKVKANAPGSFLVHIALDAGQVVNPLMEYLNADNIKIVAEATTAIIGTLGALFGLRKFLKAEPPKEVSQKEEVVEIQNSAGATVIIDRRTYSAYFNNTKVNDALSKTFKTLDSDPNITGFEITDEQEVPVFEVEREDFQPMALTSSVPQAQTRSITQRATLYIVKPSFEHNLTWNVVYAGIRASVMMEDEQFLARIDKGERFAKGDQLEVELKIDQVLDQNVGTYINRLPYHVLKVVHHIPRPEQEGLFQAEPKSLPPPAATSTNIESADENFRLKIPRERDTE